VPPGARHGHWRLRSHVTMSPAPGECRLHPAAEFPLDQAITIFSIPELYDTGSSLAIS
jgi:hypothetical protein